VPDGSLRIWREYGSVDARTHDRLRASLRRSPQTGSAGPRAQSGWTLRRRAAAWLLVLVARTITAKSVRFLERIDDARQRIFFANHTSHLDFILIWSSLPRHVREQTRPVARRDYWERSRFRRYYVRKVFNAVLIDRDGDTVGGAFDRRGREAVTQMLEGLGDEYSLILFPEGTRGSGESIGQFRSGLYYLCRERPDVELVPVRIHGADKVLPKGRWLPRPQESDLTFGPAMRLDESETRTGFSERARAALAALSRS
jgi:1-acyl-sn-glycerol-3-phosphate acyltransferase